MSFADGYVGTAEDANRIRRQQKEREKQRKKYEAAAQAKHDQATAAGLKQFSATTSEALEHAFKNETVGLVSKADFVKKRTTIQDRLEEEQRRKQQAEEAAIAEEKERKRKELLSLRAGKLSFMAGDDEEEGEDEASPAPAPVFRLPRPPGAAAAAAAPAPDTSTQQQQQQGNAGEGGAQAAEGKAGGRAHTASPSPEPDSKKRRKVGKDPTVITDFLPDRDRARQEEELRAQLRKEWQAQQDSIKSEPLAIVYSYWDGAGHRREIRVKKGDTIGGFLKAVKEQLVTDFRELRHVSVDNLMYVKEDIILPHHHTFHELIINKARGKSGPLFDFGVHEDIRVVNDASREKNESHAGKVVERHWYDRNKHIFPASRWEIYDPEKKYDTYTIYGD